jgi:hypothetical protein
MFFEPENIEQGTPNAEIYTSALTSTLDIPCSAVQFKKTLIFLCFEPFEYFLQILK